MAARYVGSGQAQSDCKQWFNSLSPENQEHVQGLILLAIKKVPGRLATSSGGPVAGAIVATVVELVMNELNENEQNKSIRAEVEAIVEESIAAASGNQTLTSTLKSSDLGVSSALLMGGGKDHVKTGSWEKDRFAVVEPSSISSSDPASPLETFNDYKDYIKWFKRNSPAKNQFSEADFYQSIRFKRR
jgi:hypothetical protein